MLDQAPSSEELRAYAHLLNIEPDVSSSDDIDVELDRLDYHGITLLALQAGNLPSALSAPVAARKIMMVANEALKRNALTDLAKALVGRDITPILFKGTALAYTVYPEPWLRPRTDTDILIDPDELDSLIELLEELGYEKLFAISGDYVSYQATYSRAVSNKVALNLDLHWRINNRQVLASAFDHAELLQRAQSLSEPLAGFRCPSNVDNLLIASLHRLGHHHREERLTWLYDIHLLAAKLKPQDWQELTERASKKQLTAVTLNALETIQKLFHTEIPQTVIERLQTPANQAEPSAIFLQRDLPEWRLFFYELRALPSWSAKFKWILENVFPNTDYTRQRMGTSNLLLAYTRRFWGGLKRLIR
jgi:hypothetical protein